MVPWSRLAPGRSRSHARETDLHPAPSHCSFCFTLRPHLLSLESNMNVLVYNGSGVSASSRDHCLHALRSFMQAAYDVQLVSPKALRDDPWTDSCALLVFPGGRDLPYLFDLAGKANDRIRNWVHKGGRYLGFCAGAYYAAAVVEFQLGTPLEVVGERELCFFPGTCRGTAFPGFQYETEAGAREVQLALDRSAWRDHWSQSPEHVNVWYNGGGSFVLDDASTRAGVVVLASYAELPDKPAAGVLCPVGQGKAVLWAAHPEHPTFTSTSSGGDDFEAKERRRRGLLRSTLALLDLDVTDEPTPPPQLLPLFLSSPDPTLVNTTASTIASKGELESSGTVAHVDRNDRFTLHPSSEASTLLSQSRDRPGSSDPEQLRTTTKEICVCSEAPPPSTLTPLFDLPRFFNELSLANGAASPPLFGNIVLYGEAVTSTQTMLDKCALLVSAATTSAPLTAAPASRTRNDRFLSALPTGLTCLASHQIAGRGRGGNSWVSPAGCLQFSLVLRLPLEQSRKIVFLQYLFGLAVVEAIRGVPGYEEVGVRLKWPNDIYGDVGGVGTEQYRKIGGILVNSSYAGEDFTLVVGMWL